jgi:hypothetical protein
MRFESEKNPPGSLGIPGGLLGLGLRKDLPGSLGGPREL